MEDCRPGEQRRGQASLEAVLDHYGIRHSTTLRSQMTNCLFHEDRTPSLSLDLGKGVFHCHSCGAGGDALTMMMMKEGSTIEEQESLQPLSDLQLETLEEATAAYQAAVTREAAHYLAGRGIDKAVATGHRLGVVADPMPGHERFRGWLAIPYLDKDGQPLTIRFRCLQQHDHRDLGHGKYMSLPDDIPRMFNIGAIHRAGDEIHVTEGELDALVLTKIGLPAVAVPGAHLWKPRHRVMLAGFNRVWVGATPTTRVPTSPTRSRAR